PYNIMNEHTKAVKAGQSVVGQAGYLRLPKDVSKKIKQLFGLIVVKARIIDTTVTPDSFPYGANKEALILEYGVLCVNDFKKGFAFCISTPSAQAYCNNKGCSKLDSVRNMVKSDSGTHIYCSKQCRKSQKLIDTYLSL
ncbi:MAG: hypothetical protein Barrevirus17_1, partial [Barrevirus sp.]